MTDAEELKVAERPVIERSEIMAIRAKDFNLDSLRGYVTRFDIGAKDGPVPVPVSFTIANSDGNEVVGTMCCDLTSVAAESYAIIFTMAMANSYEVLLTRKSGDLFYSSVQLLPQD